MIRRVFQRDDNPAESECCPARRRFLTVCGGTAALMMVNPALAGAARRPERVLRFSHLHTGETLKCMYWCEGEYVTDSLSEINHLLRDFRTAEIHEIDPALLDMLHGLQQAVGSRKPFEIISGYRSPQTNAMLRGNSSGVAKKSLHMQGRAIDVRLPGQDLNQLRLAARAMQAGGVGYYPNSNFLHLDTGRVRYW